MKLIQAGIALLGLALLAGCETRQEERREMGGTYGNGTYQQHGWDNTYGNGTYQQQGPYDTRGGWYDGQGSSRDDRRYRR